jgi:hypothetical protein
MSKISFRAPPGFVVLQGDLCFFDKDELADATSSAIEALNTSEDVCALEHLVLDVQVHLDAYEDVFRISVFIGNGGNETAWRTESSFGAAVTCFERVARDIWSLEPPWRDADITYDSLASDPSEVSGWIVQAGWTVLFDELWRYAEPPSSAAVEPMQALFVANSLHRSIAVYRINCAGTNPPYVGLLWADPIGMLYERVLFRDVGSISPWLRTRLRHGVLPRRKRRGR